MKFFCSTIMAFLLVGTTFGSMPNTNNAERELSHNGGGYCDLTGMYETLETFEFYEHIADEIGRFALYCDEPLEFILFMCLAYDQDLPFDCPEDNEDHYAFKKEFEEPDLPKGAKLCLVEGMLFDLGEDPLGHVSVLVSAPAKETLKDESDGGLFEDVFGEALYHVLEQKNDCLFSSYGPGLLFSDEWMIGFQSKPGVLTIYLDDDGPVRRHKKRKNRHLLANDDEFVNEDHRKLCRVRRNLLEDNDQQNGSRKLDHLPECCPFRKLNELFEDVVDEEVGHRNLCVRHLQGEIELSPEEHRQLECCEPCCYDPHGLDLGPYHAYKTSGPHN